MKTYNKPLIVVAIILLLIACSAPSNIEGVYSLYNNPHRFELYPDSTYIYYYRFSYPLSSISQSFSRGISGIGRDIISTGKWRRIDKNTIILNSEIISNRLPICIEKSNMDKPMIQICVNTVITQAVWKEYTDKDYCITPYINGENYLDKHPELSDEPLIYDMREMLGMDITEKSDKYLVNALPVKRGNYCLTINEPVNSIYFKIEKQPKFLERIGGVYPYFIGETENKCINSKAGDIINVTINIIDSLFSYRIFDNTKLKIKRNKLIFKDSEQNNNKNVLYLNK